MKTDPVGPQLEYRDIPGFPGYRVGSDGSFWSCWAPTGCPLYTKVMTDRWHRLKGEPRKEDGRKRYTLRHEDGTYRRAYGSHFVLEVFVGPCPPGMECCHGDGDCTNDAVCNLRWDTSAANKADMLTHGTRVRGEEVNTAKLCADDVREIRRIGKPLKPLAERFGVAEVLISAILKRKVWTHVE